MQELHEPQVVTKTEVRDVILEMIESVKRLPPHAMCLPITHYDYMSLLLLLISILDADGKSKS